ncbi:hypothetical protein RclHR1_03580014 [Rhizophagus clarus]|uniref:E3 ubiquitin-protein ligase RNF34-like isoform X2 n=1 Tax=Rhizophagus clarus TaxID=94130 RepID=A0A2Z6RB21_9GLOM|nr:hypothetical protein RclHR1_03580014 [Rhizophagus clarus]GES79089.1 E3 ubiquitin-protein ligase RNF34-like isoform X2 [Rhizophagus clarus]
MSYFQDYIRSPGTTYHEPLTRSIPKLKPLNVASCCSSCGTTFRLFRPKYNCYNCGNVTCGRCSSNRTEIQKFGYFEPVRTCDLCYSYLKIMKMNRSQLARLPIKKLREYISAYNLPCHNIIEKDDLIDIIIVHIPLEERYEVYYRDHYPTSHVSASDTQPSARTETQNDTNNTGYTRSHTAQPQPQPQPQPQTQPQPQPQPQTQSQPQPRSQTQSQPQPRSQTQSQPQPRSQTQPQPQPQPRSQPQSQQPLPQRQQNHKQSQNPSHTAPISLQTIIRDKVDVSKLSVKTIKGILKENCVDYSKMVEKSELIERMEILIKWAKHEMSSKAGEISDDGLCRICCDAQSNCLFMDCGHMCTCLDCGKKLEETKNECPICRETIIKIIRVFRA